jgi:hypothetical protein
MVVDKALELRKLNSSIHIHLVHFITSPIVSTNNFHLCLTASFFSKSQSISPKFVGYFGAFFKVHIIIAHKYFTFNPLNADLNPICHLLALLGSHHIFHVSRIRVNVCFPRLPVFEIFLPFFVSSEQ